MEIWRTSDTIVISIILKLLEFFPVQTNL